jgi:hypothetical protein
MARFSAGIVRQKWVRRLFTDCSKLIEYGDPPEARESNRHDLFRKVELGSDTRIPDETDIAIVGGGAIGMSVACWLKLISSENRSVTVVERDFTVCSHSVAFINLYSSCNAHRYYGGSDAFRTLILM